MLIIGSQSTNLVLNEPTTDLPDLKHEYPVHFAVREPGACTLAATVFVNPTSWPPNGLRELINSDPGFLRHGPQQGRPWPCGAVRGRMNERLAGRFSIEFFEEFQNIGSGEGAGRRSRPKPSYQIGQASLSWRFYAHCMPSHL